MMTLEQALDVLARSERGRAVAADLYRFLDGPASGLDQHGHAAVTAILSEHWLRPGTVLEALNGVVERS